MKITRRQFLHTAAASAAVPSATRSSGAAEWRPNGAVRILIPAAPGGATDIMGRILAQHLQTTWNVSVAVENKSGGGGTIAMAELVRQKSDGQTLGIGNPGPAAIAYSIFRNLPYKPDQLLAVSNLIRIPNIVSVHPSIPVYSIADLIAYLKSNPGALSYGTSGTGQSPHLTAAWFLQLTGLKMTHVPFRGAAPALTAALGGQIPVLFDNLFPSLPQAKDGKLRALAVTTMERSLLAPDIPTMRESARELGNFEVSSWFGVFLPGGTPAPVVDALNNEIKILLETPNVKARIGELGARPDYATPTQFAAFVGDEIEKFGAIIRKENLQMDVN
jgi:tripartite-type tricarboxylate transporter receptor subunit TctC